ncbi:DnaJ domain [Trypanosoma melophagium]|uniref:DnaJ domain n=1 Tax=Trypanosoma melophagium TaxID=715481 RepID=UPI00351A5DB9|nr:DnaJ domain [Trypanosoma melophagium]
MRSRTAFRGIFGFPNCGALLLQQRRTATQMPSEEEVRSAYAALGVATSSPFQDVKKRYVELAKQHHPDVNGGSATDASKRMVNINNAYATISRFHKAGGVLPGSYRPSSNNKNSNSSHAYYTTSDEPYQPWHEDLNPLIYEMMWDEMRRQAGGEGHARRAPYESKRRQNYQQQNHQHNHHNHNYQHQNGSDTSKSGQKKSHDENRRRPKGSTHRKTTTWPDADLNAMVNMYQDGKSFEFIANALGKKTPDVVAEFNRWSEDNRRSPRPAQRRQRGYYYAESPDIDFTDFTDDLEDPYGYGFDENEYVDPEEVFFDGGAIPFNGGHYMSGHRPRRGGGRGRHGLNNRQW